MPDDLTDLDDVQLMGLLSLLTAWQNFAARKLSEAQIDERRLENKLKEDAADALVRHWGGGRDDKVRIAEAQRDASQEVIGTRQELLMAYALRKRLEVRTDAFERDAFIVSREITRRTNMEGPYRRERNWSP